MIQCVYIAPCTSQVFTLNYTITDMDLNAPCITNTAIVYIKVEPNKWVVTNQSSVTICNTSDQLWDYIIIGAGAAGSILARKLTDDNITKVLVIEAGGNTQNDPIILNPNWLANGNTLLFSPKYATTYPIITGFLSADTYSEGRGGGGSAAHNFLLGVRGTPRIYDAWATISGNPIWSYNNLLASMKALENYTPNGTPFDFAQRGLGGPISITQGQGVTGNTYLQNFSTYSNTPFYYDYNDPPNGNCCISPVQQLVTPPPPNGTIRSYSFREFLPVGPIIDNNGNGLNGRKLKIIFNAKALKFNVDQTFTVTSVEYVNTNAVNQVLTANLKKTGILISAAGAIQTPKLLLNSGVGPAADLTAVGIPVVVNSPNVGKNLQCQYGPAAIVGGTGAGSIPFEAEAFIDGSSSGLTGGITGGAHDNIRRMQVINIPIAANALESLLSISDPQSVGSVQIVDSNPLVDPQVNMTFYSGGFTGVTGATGPSDAQLAVTFLKIVQAAANASGLFMIYPPPSAYSDDNSLLAAASDPAHVTIQSHIVGTTRMGTNISNGVVDGNLSVFGLTNVKIGDIGVEPVSADGNTCLSAYYIALTLANILGVPTPPAL
jgi:choline dehydrogenase